MSSERTIVERLRHMENGHKDNGMMYEADVCHRAAERIEELEADRTAITTCPACGSESATSNHLAINKRVHELEAHSQDGWNKYKELRKEVANNKYPELTAMVNAESVMESQSILITKLQQELAEADDATSNAQWRFEQAEATINKLREVVPKLVEVAEGGTRP